MSSYLVLENFEYDRYSLALRKRDSLTWKTQVLNGVEMFSDPWWSSNGYPDKWFTVIFEGTEDKAQQVLGAREASWMIAGVGKTPVGVVAKRSDIMTTFLKEVA
jgi:hypothetical protein